MRIHEQIAVDFLRDYTIKQLGQLEPKMLRQLVKMVKDQTEDRQLAKNLRGIMNFMSRRSQACTAVAILKALKKRTQVRCSRLAWQRVEQLYNLYGDGEATRMLKEKL